MLAVFDNVLSEEQRQTFINFFSGDIHSRKMKWENCRYEDLQKNNSALASLLNHAAKYFDLSKMVGAEYWAHYGTRPEWHVDKDEKLHQMNGNLVYPICSIVYYANINVEGGKFMTENVTIEPINNRMILFSPGILHGVEPYVGTRLSVAINPWKIKPLEYV